MKKLNCKLIVSDFDGTLANSQNGVPAEVVRAINSYVDDGGIFALCTGRILPSILPRARELGLKGLAVACQGSVIADIESGKVIKSVGFSPAQTAEICAVLEEMNTNVQAYHLNGFYSDLPADNEYLQLYQSIIGVEAEHADKKLSALAAEGEIKFNKVATMCGAREQAELYAKLCARLSGKYDVTCSAKVLIEISPYGETKGEALKFLSAHYKVPLGRCCAVGDNLNDLSMIEIAGYGVAVGNAADDLKRKAKYVTVTNDEGAVAKVIKDYGYLK